MMALVATLAALLAVWSTPSGELVLWAPVRSAGGERYLARVVDLEVAAARRHGLDPSLLLALTLHESGFRTGDATGRGVGAGLLQVHPRGRFAAGGMCCGPTVPGCVRWQVEAGARALRQALEVCAGDEWAALGFYRFGNGQCVRRERERAILVTRLELLSAMCGRDDRAKVTATAGCAARERLRSEIARSR